MTDTLVGAADDALTDGALQPDLLFAAELFRLSRRWDAKLDDRLRVTGYGRAAWATLFWLSRRPGGVTQRELAEQIGVEMSTLTRQLDQLEAAGLVVRQTSPDDRRAKRVTLTDSAAPLLERMSATAADLRDELLHGLDPQGLEAALAMLRAIRARL